MRWGPTTQVTAGVLAAALGAAAQDGSAEAELLRLTQRRFEANATNDRAFYERLMAPSCLVLLPNSPAQTKKEYLDAEFLPRPAGYRGKPTTTTEVKVSVEGDTAAVSYVEFEPVSIGDVPFELRSRRLDTYARIKGEWRLVGLAAVELPSWPDVATVDPALYAEYAGRYELTPSVSVVVTSEGGHLMAQMTGQEKTEIFPENDTTFFDRTDSPLARTTFERDGSGRVVAQVYRSQGQKQRALKVSDGAPAPGGDTSRRLVGSWRLVSYEDRPPQGPPVFPYGTRPRGMLTYDATGHMGIQVMKVPHPKVASGDDTRITLREKAALLDGYMSYFGRYRVDAGRGVVVHSVEGDLYDVFVGREEERPFTLSGDRLTLDTTWTQDGRPWKGVRVFERIRKGTVPTGPSTIVFDAEGFRVAAAASAGESVRWADVHRVEAFKRDLSTVDLLCLRVEAGGARIELNEDMEGWEEFVRALPDHLPGARPWHSWFMDVAFPAFEAKPTPVFSR